MNNKILVIITGGTIGSRLMGEERDIDCSTSELLLRGYNSQYHDEVQFVTVSPYNILSENCTPLHWQRLYDLIKSTDLSEFSGIIITHGSDTLTYTAALMGFLFHSLPVPIVFVAANHPLGHPNSNGHANFNNAVRFMIERKRGGVFVIYRDNAGTNRVYLATRLQEIDRYNDRFDGFGDVEYGQMQNGHFVPLVHELNNDACEDTYEMPDKDIEFKKQILVIKSYPGLDYSLLNLNDNVSAILCVLYHSSTWCNPDGNFFEDKYYLPEFFNKCQSRNIDTYLCSFKDGAELYKACGDLINKGAIPLRNISFEAAYTKLCIAYNKANIDPVEYMKRQVYFEYLPNSKYIK